MAVGARLMGAGPAGERQRQAHNKENLVNAFILAIISWVRPLETCHFLRLEASRCKV
jgi:hypothetical protein